MKLLHSKEWKPLLYMFVWCLSVCICQPAFGQKKQQKAIRYKSIESTHFEPGDRINLGELKVVLLPLGKDSLVIPDSMQVYREFLQENEGHLTFRLIMSWKNQGVKYPGRTDRTRNSLLEYLNEDGPDEDSTCYITLFKHRFVKQQEALLLVELEVVAVHYSGPVNLPEKQTPLLPEKNGTEGREDD